MLKPFIRLFSVVLLIAATSIVVHAQDPNETAASRATLETWRVATKEAPPFAMLSDDGNWTGLAIELFEEIASDQNKSITWSGISSTKELIEQVSAKNFDAGIAAITITAEREKALDFSHTYYNSGLAIAVSRDKNLGIFAIFKALSSPDFLATVGTLGLLLLVVGAIMWVVERKHNPEQFQNDPVRGIGNGFWWSAVTMTTVGYGDKSPITPVGRAIAIVWMFAALILTAVFTAQLTTSLTIRGISGPVSGLADLPRASVGVVSKSSSGDYFSKRYISVRTFETVADGLDALKDGKIDAFVHDEPILRFTIRRKYSAELELLDQVFEPQDYGIAMPEGSLLREQINQSLLEVRNSTRWSDIKSRYFGKED